MLTLKVTCPLAFLVLFIACVCIWCVSKLPLCMLVYTSCTRVSFVEPFASCLFLSWLLWEINGISHYGGVMCFVHLTILYMCTWVIPSSIDITRLSSRYVVCLLMRNSNSKLSINYLLLDPFICLLFILNWHHIMGE